MKPVPAKAAERFVEADKPDALRPSTALICKVASILVHVEEGSSKSGHHYDWIAVQNLIADPEVQAWLAALGAMSFVPLKR